MEESCFCNPGLSIAVYSGATFHGRHYLIQQKQELQNQFLEQQEPAFLKWDSRLILSNFLSQVSLIQATNPTLGSPPPTINTHLLPWSREPSKLSSPTCGMFCLRWCCVLSQKCRHQTGLHKALPAGTSHINDLRPGKHCSRVLGKSLFS